MNLPTDYIRAPERTNPAPRTTRATRANDLPPAWLGYLILGLFIGFLLGATTSIFVLRTNGAVF